MKSQPKELFLKIKETILPTGESIPHPQGLDIMEFRSAIPVKSEEVVNWRKYITNLLLK